MIALLLKASIILIILLVFYKLFLEKESFFSMNRIYLLGCLLLCFVLPFISLPELIKDQGIVSLTIEKHISSETISSSAKIEKQVFQKPNSKPSQDIPTKEIAKESIATNASKVTNIKNQKLEKTKRGWLDWLLIVYYFGVAIFSLNLITQVLSILFKVVKSADKIEDGEYVIINSTSIKEPCSFFKYIFINPENYDYQTYEQILEHEKIHVSNLHSIDLMLAEIGIILLWFNPLVWLFRKEIEKNIEYQTDDILLHGKKVEKEIYQMNLLKVATYNKPLTITTNYNQSLLKQRIMKMSAKKSNPLSFWKYAFILPIAFVAILFINKPNTIFAQTNPSISFINNDSAEEQITSAANETETAKLVEKIAIEKEKEAIADIENLEEKQTQFKKFNNEITFDNNCKKLLHAIRAEDIAKVKELLNSIDPNCINPVEEYETIIANGHTYHRSKAKTPFVAAARKGNLEIAKLLIAAGAKVKFHASGDETVLMAAAEYGHLEFVKLLLTEGAKLNKITEGHGTALNSAASRGHTDIVKYLLEKGADLEASNDGQGSALNAAARNGHNETVSLLLEKGADIDGMNDGQGSALNAAARNGHNKMVKLLLEQGADVNAKNDGQGSALNAAARNGHIETLKLLLENGAKIDDQNDGQGSALNAAARNGHIQVINFLLEQGANINKQNDGQGSALNAAARNGHIRVVKLLLEKGADINGRTDGQGTALNAAVRNQQYNIVKLLLENGANPSNYRNQDEDVFDLARRSKDKRLLELLEKY